MSIIKSFFSRIMGIEPVRRQSIVSFTWQIALTIIGFFSTIYFAHTVGAEVLGGFFLFLAYLNIINLVTDGGFGGAAVKRISEGEEQDAYFSAAVVLRSIFLLMVLIILITFRNYFVDLNNSGTFVWLLVALVVTVLQGSISSGVAGCGKVGIQSTAVFIDSVSRILIQVVAIYLGYGVAGLTGGFVAGAFIGAIVQVRFFELHFARFEWRHLKSLSSFSFWSFLVSSGGLVFMYSDSVIIGYFLNNDDVGVYRIIFQLTLFASFATTALRGTLWPRVSRWDKIGKKTLIEDSLSHAITYSFILALPLFVGGALLGDKILYYFYGSQFVNYSTLMILFITQIVNIFQYFFTTYLSAMDQVKEVSKITAVAVASNIIMNIVLIPLMGITGAAIATLITMSINAVLVRNVLARLIIIKLDINSLLNIFKASIVMGVVVSIYRLIIPLSNVWIVLVAITLGGMVYGMSILKFDEKICEELKYILTKMNIAYPSWL